MTSKWHGWFTLSGVTIKGTPAVVHPTPWVIDIYVQGTNDVLYQKWWDGYKWGPSESEWLPHYDGGFRLGSSPAVVAPTADVRHVYARGQDGIVYYKVFANGNWGSWKPLGGIIIGDPTAITLTPSSVDVYVRGTDDRLYQKTWLGTYWWPSDYDWHQHDDGNFRLGSEPVAVGNNNHREVFVRGQNGGVYHKKWSSGQPWSNWLSLGGVIKGKPIPLIVNQYVQDVYVQGTDNRVWQKSWDGYKWLPSDWGWNMHHDGNFRLDGPPAALSNGNNNRELFARGTDGIVNHKIWDNERKSNAVIINTDTALSAQIDDFVKDMVKKGQPGVAIAVIKGGQIVHLAGYGTANKQTGEPITSETMFHMASAGKQFTALGIMMLKEMKGFFSLDYDDLLVKYLPQLANWFPPGYNKVTLRHLLNHTSGMLDFYTDEEGAKALFQQSSRPTNADEIQTYVKLKFPKKANPGDVYAYSNTEYDMLGSVIEKFSGQSYVNFFRTRVFDLLGMTDSFSLPDYSRINDPNIAIGYEFENGWLLPQEGSRWDSIVGSGSFYSSAYDLCAYEIGLSNNMLVSADSMKTACTIGKTNDGQPNAEGYGFGWFIANWRGEALVQHAGNWTGFYPYIRRFLNKPLSIYVLCNRAGLDVGSILNTVSDLYVPRRARR